jgi:hypothetical protein
VAGKPTTAVGTGPGSALGLDDALMTLHHDCG